MGAYGAGHVGRAQQHLWSYQFVVVAAAWEDMGAEDRSVNDVHQMQMVARLKVMFYPPPKILQVSLTLLGCCHCKEESVLVAVPGVPMAQWLKSHSAWC